MHNSTTRVLTGKMLPSWRAACAFEKPFFGNHTAKLYPFFRKSFRRGVRPAFLDSHIFGKAMEATVLQCLALHIRQRHARSSAGVSAIACECVSCLSKERAFPKKWVLLPSVVACHASQNPGIKPRPPWAVWAVLETSDMVWFRARVRVMVWAVLETCDEVNNGNSDYYYA